MRVIKKRSIDSYETECFCCNSKLEVETGDIFIEGARYIRNLILDEVNSEIDYSIKNLKKANELKRTISFRKFPEYSFICPVCKMKNYKDVSDFPWHFYRKLVEEKKTEIDRFETTFKRIMIENKLWIDLDETITSKSKR